MPGGRGRPGGDLVEGHRPIANGSLDGPVFDVIAAAYGLEAAHHRMDLVIRIHARRGYHKGRDRLPPCGRSGRLFTPGADRPPGQERNVPPRDFGPAIDTN